jgi:hypothetical protein
MKRPPIVAAALTTLAPAPGAMPAVIGSRVGPS